MAGLLCGVGQIRHRIRSRGVRLYNPCRASNSFYERPSRWKIVSTSGIARSLDDVFDESAGFAALPITAGGRRGLEMFIKEFSHL